VDDGSSDTTCTIVEKYRGQFDWIDLLKREDRGFRQAGSGVVDAFNFGLDRLQDVAWNYIIKLDGDLELPKTILRSSSGNSGKDRNWGSPRCLPGVAG